MALDYPANPLSVLRVLYGSAATLLIRRARETDDTVVSMAQGDVPMTPHVAPQVGLLPMAIKIFT
jgi:hypothetical protein